MKLYIIGPMTGLPDDNRPAFNAMAANLRALGHEVLNPAEFDLDVGPCHNRHECYRRDAPFLAQAEGGVVLPGWWKSFGARHEVYTLSEVYNMPLYEYREGRGLVEVGYTGLRIITSCDDCRISSHG